MLACSELSLQPTIPISEIYMDKKSPYEEAKGKIETLKKELEKAEKAFKDMPEEENSSQLTNVQFIEIIDDFRIKVEKEVENVKKADLLAARARRKEEEKRRKAERKARKRGKAKEARSDFFSAQSKRRKTQVHSNSNSKKAKRMHNRMKKNKQKMKSKKNMFIRDDSIQNIFEEEVQAKDDDSIRRLTLSGWQSVKLTPERSNSDCFLECIGYLLNSDMRPYSKNVKRELTRVNAHGEDRIKELMLEKDFSDEEKILEVAIGLDRGIIVHIFEKEKMKVIFQCEVSEDIPSLHLLHCNKKNHLDDEQALNFFRPLKVGLIESTKLSILQGDAVPRVRSRAIVEAEEEIIEIEADPFTLSDTLDSNRI